MAKQFLNSDYSSWALSRLAGSESLGHVGNAPACKDTFSIYCSYGQACSLLKRILENLHLVAIQMSDTRLVVKQRNMTEDVYSPDAGDLEIIFHPESVKSTAITISGGSPLSGALEMKNIAWRISQLKTRVMNSINARK